MNAKKAEGWITFDSFVKNLEITKMTKRPGFNTEKLKRVHRKELLFNTSELNAIEMYCKRYKIRNKSKFLREAIISKVLNQFEQDHPRLF